MLVERGDSVVDELSSLGALGVRLAVDDFGTGYSSLSSLSRFAVDVLKIDRSFVAGLDGRPDADALMRSIVQLGGSLGLRAVAEGIEAPEQADALESVGCEMAQGYHYARRMTPDDVSALLQGDGVLEAGLGPPLPRREPDVADGAASA